MEVATVVTRIDVDDDALAEAMRLSGLKTKKETVNLALREYATRHGRLQAIERYASLAYEWDYEGWQQLSGSEEGSAGCQTQTGRR